MRSTISSYVAFLRAVIPAETMCPATAPIREGTPSQPTSESTHVAALFPLERGDSMPSSTSYESPQPIMTPLTTNAAATPRKIGPPLNTSQYGS